MFPIARKLSGSLADKPTTDPPYLGHPLDLETHVRLVRSVETIVATEPIAGVLKFKS